jgi:hypothetical protein
VPQKGQFYYGFAEREGFEPPDLLQSTVFKTAALNRSAISPAQKYTLRLFYKKNFAALLFQSELSPVFIDIPAL